jgi:hypothetical protein
VNPRLALHVCLFRTDLKPDMKRYEFGASGSTALMTATRLDLVETPTLLLLDRGAKPDLGAGDAVAELYPEGDALCM